MMTHSDLHMAVRLILRGTPYVAFHVGVTSTELHPARVAIEYLIFIPGIERQFRSADPKRILSWVRAAVKAEVDEAPPAALLAIGSPPRLRRVK